MKQLIIASLLLSSCSWISPPAFDSGGYQMLVRINTHSQYLINSECGEISKAKLRLVKMKFDSDNLVTFSKFLSDYEEIYEISTIINDDINSLHARFVTKPPSKAFCIAKSKIINLSTLRTLETIGKLQGG